MAVLDEAAIAGAVPGDGLIAERLQADFDAEVNVFCTLPIPFAPSTISTAFQQSPTDVNSLQLSVTTTSFITEMALSR